MSNTRHAQPGQPQPGRLSPYWQLQSLPPEIRPHHIPFGIIPEVVPNTNLDSDVPKLINLTVMHPLGAYFIPLAPAEWEVLRDQIDSLLSEARSSLVVAKEGDLSGLRPA